MNCARNYKNLLNFVKVMPKILVVPFFSGHGVVLQAGNQYLCIMVWLIQFCWHQLIFSMRCIRWNELSRYCHDVRPSICLSICRMGVHCDHTVLFRAHFCLQLDSPMSWAPWHQSMSTCSQPSFSSSTWKRGGVWMCKLGKEFNANNDK